MRKMTCFSMILVLVALLAMPACADSGLPTINQVLQQGLKNQKIEVSDNLDDYSILNESFEEISNKLCIIILQRESPEKEFTAKKTFPPFSDTDGFPDDYEGVDLGKGRLWLRSDLMLQIPSDYCAKSLEDSTYIIMAEDLYTLGGSISVLDYKDSGVDVLPEFESAEEMALYLLNHPKEIESMTYYPKFGVFSVVSMYEAQTKKNMLFDYKYEDPIRFARNPEADEYWNNMTYVVELLDCLDENKEIKLDRANELLDLLDFLPESKKTIWTSCIIEGEYSTAYHSINGYLWKMAEELKELDHSEENKKDYNLIIEDKNLTALQLFVNFCDYAGFDRSVSSIEAAKDYLAKPDKEWMEQTLAEMVDLFN